MQQQIVEDERAEIESSADRIEKLLEANQNNKGNIVIYFSFSFFFRLKTIFDGIEIMTFVFGDCRHLVFMYGYHFFVCL